MKGYNLWTGLCHLGCLVLAIMWYVSGDTVSGNVFVAAAFVIGSAAN